MVTASATRYPKIILRGVGQVMLQNSALTGLLFVVGIFYNSWILGLGAIVGNIIGTLSAVVLRYSKDDISNGLYGFNGTLVGIAVWFFLGHGMAATIAMVLGAVLSTVIMHEMKKKVPALTAPFVIATWIVILGTIFTHHGSLIFPSVAEMDTLHPGMAVTTGLGQVMFQNNVITGLIFFLAILLHSRTAALYALYGSLLGGLFALAFSLPLATINVGIFGYNAVLCGIYFGDMKRKSYIFASIAIVLSVLVYLVFDKLGIAALTAPFVIATWITLLINRTSVGHHHF